MSQHGNFLDRYLLSKKACLQNVCLQQLFHLESLSVNYCVVLLLTITVLAVLSIHHGISGLLKLLDMPNSAFYRVEGANETVQFFRHGCPVVPAWTSRTGDAQYFFLPPPSEIDEVLTVSKVNVDRFAVWGRSEPSSQWGQLASSNPSQRAHGYADQHCTAVSCKLSMPRARVQVLGSIVAAFWTKSWASSADSFATPLILGFGVATATFLGTLGATAAAHAAAAITTALMTAVCAAAAAGHAMGNGGIWCGAPLLFASFFYAVLTALLCRSDRFATEAAAAVGFLTVISGLALAAPAPAACEYALRWPAAELGSVAFGLVFCAATTFRRLRSQAAQNIRDDKAQIGAAWDVAIAKRGERAALRRLEVVTDTASFGLPVAAAVRQTCPPAAAGMPWSVSFSSALQAAAGVERPTRTLSAPVDESTTLRFDTVTTLVNTRLGAWEDALPEATTFLRSSSEGGSTAASRSDQPAPPVTSLDQLYAQALGVAPLLRARLAAWAAASGGRVDRPSLQSEPGTLEALIKEGLVKEPMQAAAKAVACHGGDVSRLLDICRGRLAFKRAANLCTAAEALLADPATEVVAICNTLQIEPRYLLCKHAYTGIFP